MTNEYKSQYYVISVGVGKYLANGTSRPRRDTEILRHAHVWFTPHAAEAVSRTIPGAHVVPLNDIPLE